MWTRFNFLTMFKCWSHKNNFCSYIFVLDLKKRIYEHENKSKTMRYPEISNGVGFYLLRVNFSDIELWKVSFWYKFNSEHFKAKLST